MTKKLTALLTNISESDPDIDKKIGLFSIDQAIIAESCLGKKVEELTDPECFAICYIANADLEFKQRLNGFLLQIKYPCDIINQGQGFRIVQRK